MNFRIGRAREVRINEKEIRKVVWGWQQGRAENNEVIEMKVREARKRKEIRQVSEA